MKYRKKPVVIEAMVLDGLSRGLVVDPEDERYDALYIETLEGEMTASAGDFSIRGVQGEFYPCKPDIFEATYEPVD